MKVYESPSRDVGLKLLRQMRVIRQLSERIISIYLDDVMETPVHLCIGQEAVSVGLCAHLSDLDTLFMTHRTHAPALAKGLPLKRLVAELMGRTTGCSHGRGGSMHVIDLEHGIPGSSAIVGGSIALGVGGGLSAKLRGEERIAVSYFGDGATNAGVFWESLNFAALKKIPVLFLCENNKLSNLMPKHDHSFVDLPSIAEKFMPTYGADGTDVLAVYERAGEAVAQVRAEGGPVFLECVTKRWMKHQGVDQDDLECNPIDRSKDCPLQKLEQAMISGNQVSQGDIDRLIGEVENELDEAFAFAEASPYPAVTELER